MGTTGMAFQDTFCREHEAFAESVFPKGDQPVLRAGRFEATATGEKGREARAVEQNEHDSRFAGQLRHNVQNFAHDYRLSSRKRVTSFLQARTTLLYSCSVVARLARKTTSYPGHGPPTSRQTARILRFARLRQTALPNFLPATKAARPCEPCCALFWTTRSVMAEAPNRFPCANTWEISVLDLMISTTRFLHGKALAALSATSGENLTAALGGHAGAEAMSGRTLMFVRLVGAFHICSLSYLQSNFQNIRISPQKVKKQHSAWQNDSHELYARARELTTRDDILRPRRHVESGTTSSVPVVTLFIRHSVPVVTDDRVEATTSLLLSPAGENGIHGGFQKHSTAFNEIHSTFQIVNSTLNNVENVENSYKPRKSMWKTVFRTPLPPM